MHRIAFAILLVALVAIGCGSGPKTYRVAGIATWQNKPIDDGQIIFEAEDGQTTPAACRFTAGGKYEVRVTAGTKRIRVYGQRSKGFDKVMNQETFEGYVPPDFNAKSEIRFEVQPNDDNVFDLKLPKK